MIRLKGIRKHYLGPSKPIFLLILLFTLSSVVDVDDAANGKGEWVMGCVVGWDRRCEHGASVRLVLCFGFEARVPFEHPKRFKGSGSAEGRFVVSHPSAEMQTQCTRSNSYTSVRVRGKLRASC